ncbi:lipocalin-like domain-containing protein [Pseudahrensia aquimaris]|uniref:Lipocalin-like domain-containing protein n=1 Tax=Pseudahrensia aquimaris TaxID=744461 RepID=A0ABW3FGU4_9HYPH
MSARLIASLLFCLFGLSTVLAQGFGGLGIGQDGYSKPIKGKAFDFPKDHGPHPDYRIEWWYVTSTLKGDDGNDYGIQWTLFRSAFAPPSDTSTVSTWNNGQLWMGHAALTSATSHFVAERRARGGVSQAGVRAQPFSAWIDDWEMTAVSDQTEGISQVKLAANGEGFSYDLRLDANGPLVLHGDKGYSVKSPDGQASYYFSQPFYRVSGALRIEGKSIQVTGEAWLDREWSSQPLSETQTGWDWVSLSFDSGEKLMGFQVRTKDGAPFTSATWISADGTPTAFGDGALKMTALKTDEVAGRRVPTGWRVELPQKDVDVEISALNPDSWMATSIPYWEGPVSIKGTKAGRGYLEMTGY